MKTKKIFLLVCILVLLSNVNYAQEGDASLDDPNIYTSSAGPNGTYTGPNAGKYRLGALSGGYKGFEAGLTSEGIRNATQNWWHDRKFMHTERFAVLKDKFPTRPYFQYSTSYNYTLW